MPSDNLSGTTNPVPASGVADKLSSASSQIKAKAAEVGRAAADMIDGNRDTAADKLLGAAGKIQGAADTLDRKADSLPGGARLVSVAHVAADSLTSTADYLRANDVRSMLADIKRVAADNPGPVLLGAAVLGYVVARSLARD